MLLRLTMIDKFLKQLLLITVHFNKNIKTIFRNLTISQILNKTMSVTKFISRHLNSQYVVIKQIIFNNSKLLNCVCHWHIQFVLYNLSVWFIFITILNHSYVRVCSYSYRFWLLLTIGSEKSHFISEEPSSLCLTC